LFYGLNEVGQIRIQIIQFCGYIIEANGDGFEIVMEQESPIKDLSCIGKLVESGINPIIVFGQ
jgi:hypothetical protein